MGLLDAVWSFLFEFRFTGSVDHDESGLNVDITLIVPNIRPYHFCMTFDLEEESAICYAFWFPYEVYI